MNKQNLETQRLLLRPFTEADIPDFTEICHDPEVMRYAGGMLDDATIREKVLTWIAYFKKNNFGLYALTHKADNALIGFCGLLPQKIDDETYLELGYRLAKAYWGSGLATEAALCVKEFAFNQLKLPYLISIIHVENHASIAVAKKIGLKEWKQTQYKSFPVKIYRISNDSNLNSANDNGMIK